MSKRGVILNRKEDENIICRIQLTIYSLLVGFWLLFSGEVKANTWTQTALGDFMKGKQEQVTCGVLPMEIYMVSKDVDLKLATVDTNWYWSSWNAPDVGYYASPTFCDLDNDGDYDLMIASQDGGNCYGYENTGNKINPIWTAKPDWNGPRVGDYGWYAKPAFCDLDNDGDYDLMIGHMDGSPNAYENIGSKTKPIWTYKPDWNTPHIGEETKPAFCDLDNDGDYDLLIGAVSGISWSIENIATHFPMGTFTSSVFGTGTNILDWDVISWIETKSLNTNVVIELRTGNTLIPDENWSEWNSVTNGTTISNSNSRYIQLRGILSTTDLSQTPMIHNITLIYHFPLQAILVSPTSGQVGKLVTYSW
ncbi:MAG: VCBS repeat-containing protein [bacterium]